MGRNGRLTALAEIMLCQSVSWLKVEVEKSYSAMVELLPQFPTVMHLAAPGLLAENHRFRLIERGAGEAGGSCGTWGKSQYPGISIVVARACCVRWATQRCTARLASGRRRHRGHEHCFGWCS